MSNVIDIKTRLARAKEASLGEPQPRLIHVDELSENEFNLYSRDGYVYLGMPFAMEHTLQLSPNVARVLGLVLIEQAAMSGIGDGSDDSE